jgi:methionine sulfoxide reductase heme-binding subunit
MAAATRSILDYVPFARLLRAPKKREPVPWLKPGIFLGGLVPLGFIVLRGVRDQLGANPIATIENELGLVALIFLVASLACTPARRLFGWTWPPRIRRELGLFAFFYATLHFLMYLALDLAFDWSTVAEDIAKRPFITVGFAALVLMAPLALTSTNGWIKRLGYYRWIRLHQLVDVAGALAVLHFIWRVKIDLNQPLTYAAVFLGLIAVRVLFWARSRSSKRRS